MTSREVPTATREPPLPGTGRLGVVAAYFTLAGLGTGVMTLFAAKALLITAWHGEFAADSARVALFGAVLTFGYLRTDRLLSQRQKLGGYAALVCLGGTVVSGFLSGGSTFLPGVALAGLGLLSTVWRHLE